MEDTYEYVEAVHTGNTKTSIRTGTHSPLIHFVLFYLKTPNLQKCTKSGITAIKSLRLNTVGVGINNIRTIMGRN